MPDRAVVHDPGAAEDLTIETFWRIYRSRARFDPERSFGAWTRTIAVHAAIDFLKRQTRDRPEAADAIDPLAQARVEVGDARRALMRAFAALPAALRVTATLAFVEERPYQEIADTLGVSLGTVKSRVFRATRLLRHELTRLGWQR
jgi:RNA polymerase sigma-70 factor (ECF subfamily)